MTYALEYKYKEINRNASPKEMRNEMTREQTLRLNELMRIAKGDEFMSMVEFDELAMLMKIRGYH